MAWSEADIIRYTPAQLKEIAELTREIGIQTEEMRRDHPHPAPIEVYIEWSAVSGKDVWEGVADQWARAGWFVYLSYRWCRDPDRAGILFCMRVRSHEDQDAEIQKKTDPCPGGVVVTVKS